MSSDRIGSAGEGFYVGSLCVWVVISMEESELCMYKNIKSINSRPLTSVICNNPLFSTRYTTIKGIGRV